MPITTQTFKEVPPELLTLLLRFLPESLTVLRRLQFIKITTIQRPHGQIIFCSSDGPLSDTAANTINSFTVSYLDIAGGPDTQMWLFSTLQCRPSDSQETAQCKEQLDALVQQVTSINKAYGKPLHYGDSVVLGSLENHVRALFQIEKLVTPRPSGNYDKWVLNLDDIPASNDALPEGMVWGTGSLDDCKLVASRTDIPRPPEFLVQLQNYFIKLEDGTPVAWAFLGSEATLISVHCEEPYRRRGLAKLISIKLLRDKVAVFGPGGLSSADVAASNTASRALCKGLGGYPTSIVSWVMLKVE